MSACPSIYVPKEASENATQLIRKKIGRDVRNGVELLLKSDLGDQNTPNSVDAGALVQEGLAFLANSPFEALDISMTSQTIDVRKSYKKLALKYHPDKNPTTTPLFQAIQTAHEKLTNKENRELEEEKMKAEARAATAAAHRPSEPPPASHPPQRPPTAGSSRATGTGGSSADPSAHHTSDNSNSQQSSRPQETSESEDRRSKTERLKAEIARQRAAEEAARRKAEEEEEAKYAGLTHEEREMAKHRERERQKAAERTAARRAKTGYAKYEPTPASTAAGTGGGNGSGVGTGGREGTKDFQAETETAPEEDPGSNSRDKPPGGDGGNSNRRGSGTSSTAGETETEQECSKPAEARPRDCSEGPTSNLHHERRRRKEKKADAFALPVPINFTGTALNHSSAQLQWQCDLPPTPSQKEREIFSAMRTELGWREVVQYVQKDGAVYSSNGREDFTVGAVLLVGEKVVKKNLRAGHKYEFRVRFVVPTDPSSTSGKDGLALKGAWCEAVTVGLPSRPAGSDFVSPGVDNDIFEANREEAGLKRNDSQLPQKGAATAATTAGGAAHVHNVQSMRNKQQQQQQPTQWGGNSVADSTASLYGRHFGSATSLPEESPLGEDDIVPDQWVEDESDSEGEESPTAKRKAFRRDPGHPQHNPHADTEEHSEEHTKWYQLMPPDSHVGTGKYKHPVRAACREEASVLGYVSTANKVKARRKTKDWMMVQVHWTTAAAALSGDSGGETGAALPYGWMKRSEWNHRLQREHELLRHIPESYKEMKKFNHVNVSIPEEDETDDTHTPLAAKQHDMPQRWQRDVKTKRAEESMDAAGGFEFSKASSHSASGNIDIWYEQVDEGGYLYYYNAATGESRWEPPEWVEETDSQSGARYFVQLNKDTGNVLKSTWSRPQLFSRLVRQSQE